MLSVGARHGRGRFGCRSLLEAVFVVWRHVGGVTFSVVNTEGYDGAGRSCELPKPSNMSGWGSEPSCMYDVRRLWFRYAPSDVGDRHNRRHFRLFRRKMRWIMLKPTAAVPSYSSMRERLRHLHSEKPRENLLHMHRQCRCSTDAFTLTNLQTRPRVHIHESHQLPRAAGAALPS
jgi:hypothetical protein